MDHTPCGTQGCRPRNFAPCKAGSNLLGWKGTNYGPIMSLFRRTNQHDTVIKFNASRELKDDLIDLAEERNISLSALLRLVLTEYVRNNK